MNLFGIMPKDLYIILRLLSNMLRHNARVSPAITFRKGEICSIFSSLTSIEASHRKIESVRGTFFPYQLFAACYGK